MRRLHTTPDAYGTELLERQWGELCDSSPDGPATAALHTRSASARALLAHAAARRSVDELIGGAYEGRLFPDADPWVFGELARVIALQDLWTEDRADAMVLLDSLLRTAGAAGVAPRHQGLHAQLAFVTGDRTRTEKLLADYPQIPDPVRTALVVDLTTGEDWTGRFLGLLPAPGFTLDGEIGPRFDRIRSNRAGRAGSAHRITTIVTTYRPGLPLLTAVRSLVAQSWTNHEILVVDDGSGPGHDAVLDRAAALDPRVRVLRMPQNGGTYLARNAGLDAATGTFVTFQDSDDWSHPLRLERQVAPLIADETLFATTSAAIRVTEDLTVTRPGVPEHRSYNLSSLMIRREAALQRLGYLDTVRKGADAEYVERARAVFGRPAVHHLGGEPLALVRLGAGTLSSADIAPGWMHPARHAYLSAFQAWHRRLTAGRAEARRERLPGARAFAVPRRLALHSSSQRALAASACPPASFSGGFDLPVRDYDVILAADWSALPPGLAEPHADRLRAVAVPGRSVAVLHLSLLRNVTGRPANLDPDVQEMINSGRVDQVVLSDEVTARLVLVQDPALVGFAPGYPSAIRADRVVIEADSAWGEAAFHCEAEARRLFGVEPWWAPAGAADRRHLAGGPFGIRLAKADLPATIDPDRWRLHRTGPRADRPVIGRVLTARPGAGIAAEWLRLREALPTPAGLDVRVLAPEPPAKLGKNWLVYRPSDVEVRAFLHQLDFYLHLLADERTTTLDPELLAALAAGCVPVLPHRYRPLLGTAAVYCEPAEVAGTVAKLHRRPEALVAQSRRGLEFVRREHHHGRFAEAVAVLLTPDPVEGSAVAALTAAGG
ncbi:putative glycosyltransferase [Actinoplanes missouriensis 431]|uniref:Putative glycosyltransferase n=1 Tax=Actinoplanes missouriensis (strain ATCC 14538 / DSM 43046 / CBS 188.64 / JCM 3121 / NBRC 102363 / NCIMB 12654 / NRRL B-3342 / UNCC 431) TaxID=512565 RepID=I0HGX8_ACTM4|nr:glycosyltransferase [Actinoplanes missouriensis]BAL92265.1 putative glycosyltransferase [Actinoplanes missouriensis 431]